MARALARGGRVVLSGILLEERATMNDLLDVSGWMIEDDDTEDIWWSATVSHR
jgi:ribosomal protein L11 methyltransferase